MGNSEVDVAPTVFLSYIDITAAASRAMFGVEGDCVYQVLNVPSLEGAAPACVHPADTKSPSARPSLATVQVINCQFEQNKPQFTFLVINTKVLSEKSHYVAKAIVDLCSQRAVRRLVVFTCQRLDTKQQAKLFENSFNGIDPITQANSLPHDTHITDVFLSNLIQLCTVEGQPFTVITAPAFPGASGRTGQAERLVELIRLFQNTVTNFCGLKFSEKTSTSLIYNDCRDDPQFALMYA